jgi:hypothetical protein
VTLIEATQGWLGHPALLFRALVDPHAAAIAASQREEGPPLDSHRYFVAMGSGGVTATPKS